MTGRQQSELSSWGDDDSLLDAEAVGKLVGVGEQTIRRWVRAGTFPAPHHITGKITRWRLSAVREWRNQVAPGGAV